MGRLRILVQALPLLAFAACHGDVEMLPLIDRKIYLTDRFYDVDALTPDKAIVVGYGGKILLTSDSGRSWKRPAAGTDQALYNTVMQDEKTGWIVGQGGTALKTTDGGETWTKLTTGTENSLFSVALIGPDHLIAVGERSTIAESKDGGATWTVRQYETKNSGLTADEEAVAQEPGLYAVQFIDPNTGWIVGEFGKIAKTTDGGKTWKEQQSTLIGGDIVDALSLPTFFGVHFINAKEGIATGLDGRIAHTVDGGATWMFDDVNDQVTTPLFNGQLFADSSGWAVGTGGEVLRKKGIGETWQPADVGMRVQSWLRRVSFVDQNNGWVVGGFGLILHTRDGGKTWIPTAA